MKHLIALIMKFVMIFVVLYLVIGLLFGVSFTNILAISLFLTVVAYLTGDLGVLPMGGNLIASVVDFGLAFIGIWLIALYILGVTIPMSGILSAAVIVALREWFFHKYLNTYVIDTK